MSIFETKAPSKAEPEGQAIGPFTGINKVQEKTPPNREVDVHHVPNAPHSGRKR